MAEISAVELRDRTGIVLTGPRKRPPPPPKRRAAGSEPSMVVTRRRGSIGFAPWAVTLLFAAIAGFGGYYMLQKQHMAEDGLAEARAELALVKDRAAASEDAAMTARADAVRARSQLASTREGMTELEQRMKEKTRAADELAQRLESIVGKDQGELISENGQLTLRLMDRVLFATGEADLTERGKQVMDKVALALATVPDQQAWVQGHTDDVPISHTNRRFATNWELSAARALTVVHYLQEQGKVDPRRLAAVAFGEHRPASRRSKAKNRRIEIVLAPRDVKLVKEPSTAASE